MKKLIEIQKKLVPEVLETLERRYSILKQISLNEPIGRRALSTALGLSERIVRSEVDFLKSQDLLEINTFGMNTTPSGCDLLENLKEYLDEMFGIPLLEEKIKNKLGIKKVIIVSGNMDIDNSVVKGIAKATYKYLMKIICDEQIIGVTGGNTMSEFAKCVDENKKYKNLMVVPARGGLGKEVEIQANSIAATVGKKLGAQYRLLHVPDNIGKDTLSSIIQEPEIKITLQYMQKIDVLVFGIGKAEEMARRRKMDDDEIGIVLSKDGVAEAFGYYFNKNGEIIHETSTVGITLQSFKDIKSTIGIAGGSKKAQAIMSISKIKKDLVLITDEAAAHKILELI